MKTALALLLAASAAPQQSLTGDALRLRGDYRAAEAVYRNEHAWSGLATLYLETNRLAGAEAAARLAFTEAAPDSPDAAYALGLLGSVLSRQGRHDEAEHALRDAIRLCTATLGPSHLQTARLRANLAAALVARGRLASAEPLLHEAETTLRRYLGETHMEVAVLRHNLGALYLRQGRLALAESEFNSALQAWERLYGERSPYYIQTANLLIRTRCAAFETAAAERLLSRVLPLSEELLGPGHPETARARLNQAALALQRNDPVSAEQSARSAIESQLSTLPANRAEFLDQLNFYRAILSRLGRQAAARRVNRWQRHIRKTPPGSTLSAYVKQSCAAHL